jgi:hypothetical protein
MQKNDWHQALKLSIDVIGLMLVLHFPMTRHNSPQTPRRDASRCAAPHDTVAGSLRATKIVFVHSLYSSSVALCCPRCMVMASLRLVVYADVDIALCATISFSQRSRARRRPKVVRALLKGCRKRHSLQRCSSLTISLEFRRFCHDKAWRLARVPLVVANAQVIAPECSTDRVCNNTTVRDRLGRG